MGFELVAGLEGLGQRAGLTRRPKGFQVAGIQRFEELEGFFCEAEGALAECGAGGTVLFASGPQHGAEELDLGGDVGEVQRAFSVEVGGLAVADWREAVFVDFFEPLCQFQAERFGDLEGGLEGVAECSCGFQRAGLDEYLFTLRNCNLTLTKDFAISHRRYLTMRRDVGSIRAAMYHRSDRDLPGRLLSTLEHPSRQERCESYVQNSDSATSPVRKEPKPLSFGASVPTVALASLTGRDSSRVLVRWRRHWTLKAI